MTVEVIRSVLAVLPRRGSSHGHAREQLSGRLCGRETRSGRGQFSRRDPPLASGQDADRCATVRRVTVVHNLLGLASIAGSLTLVAAAVWSVFAGRHSAGHSDHRFAVDRAVLAALLLVGAAGLVGLVLLIIGSRPADPLHLVYGPAALISVPVAIWIGRASPAGRSRVRRDIWTAAGGIVLFGLGLRLVATG